MNQLYTGAISAVLVFYDVKNPLAWVINIVVLLFVMFSRLYLAVHWPQESPYFTVLSCDWLFHLPLLFAFANPVN